MQLSIVYRKMNKNIFCQLGNYINIYEMLCKWLKAPKKFKK